MYRRHKDIVIDSTRKDILVRNISSMIIISNHTKKKKKLKIEKIRIKFKASKVCKGEYRLKKNFLLFLKVIWKQFPIEQPIDIVKS